MRSLLLRLALVVAAFVGLLDASFLTYESLSGRIPPCAASSGCETVLTSQWASVGPIPTAALGVGYYAVVLGLAMVWYFSQQKWTVLDRKFSPLTLLLLVLSSGLVVTWFLIYLMAVVIQSWCIYCLVSAATTHLAWVLTLVQWRKDQTV